MPDPVLTSELESSAGGQGELVSSSWGGRPEGGGPPVGGLPGKAPAKRLRTFGRVQIALMVLGLLVRVGLLGYRIFEDRKKPHQAWHHEGAVARADELHGVGRVYLVQVGKHTDPYEVVEMATWLRDAFGLDTQLLAAMPMDAANKDSGRRMYVADRIVEQIKRDHPALAADPNVTIIGFTDAEMYSITGTGNSMFSWRDGQRTAIISSDGMLGGVAGIPFGGREATRKMAWDRLRRILLRDLAVMYWHLPLNNDPGSALYYRLNPYLPGQEIYETDLDPMRSKWGAYFADPCLTLTHTAGGGVAGPTTLFHNCTMANSFGELQSAADKTEAAPDLGEERMEVRLAYGLLTERHTDFFLPGAVPILLERATTNRWQMPGAFGMSGSHNYDRYLTSHDGMKRVEVASSGSMDLDLKRRPGWLPYLPWDTWTSTDSASSAITMRWVRDPEHFELARYDGAVEYYLPCDDAVLCLLDGIRNVGGKPLHFERDQQRNLMSLNGSDHHWHRFTHDAEVGVRVKEILDSTGRRVKYEYNGKGQLASVAYPSGEALRYEYDDRQDLLSVKASEGGGGEKTLVTNAYVDGELTSQTLMDGEVYQYASVARGRERWVGVRVPDGTVYDVGFGGAGAVVLRRP